MRFLPLFFFLTALSASATTPYDEAVSFGLPKIERKDFAKNECKPGAGGEFCSVVNKHPHIYRITIYYGKDGTAETYTVAYDNPEWKAFEKRYGKGDRREDKDHIGIVTITNEWEKDGVTISALEYGGEFSVLFVATPR